MSALPAILCLLIAAAGWFYLFYSRAAANLVDVEAAPINRRRVTLRRVGGVSMIVLAATMYVGIAGVDAQQTPNAFVALWLGVMLLMAIIVVLGLIDLRLTARLRKRKAGKNRHESGQP